MNLHFFQCTITVAQEGNKESECASLFITTKQQQGHKKYLSEQKDTFMFLQEMLVEKKEKY